jgi:hypothetical protein
MQKFCECHEVAIILNSGKDKNGTCPACGFPRLWFFAVVKGKNKFIAMMKKEPFTCENPNPIKEPGELWFEFGETQEQAFQKLRAQHCVHADEKPATIKVAFSAQNILSRLVGWFSTFRR